MKIIGVDIGATKIKAGIVSGNKVLKTVKHPTHAKASSKQLLKHITNVIDSLFDKSIKAIGIGAPGLPDLKTGILYEAYNIPAWTKVQIVKVLKKKYRIPIYLNNDANCFALAEKTYGSCKKHKNIVGLTLGTGLGGGIIINNKLYCGSGCGASEFGRIVYLDGELEDYCSGKFFIKKYKIKGEEISKKVRQKNRTAQKACNEYGYHLGKALSIVANALNPEIIIFGGSIIKDYKFFKKPMMKSFKESTYKRIYKTTRVYKSTLKDSAILGAAALTQ